MLYAESVRRGISVLFRQLAPNLTEPLQEIVLVRDGKYSGRRFLADGLEAVWLVDDNRITFYDASGRLVRLIPADEVARTAARHAA